MSTDQKFQQHIHVFRAVAIIFIVCAHTLPSLDWSAQPILGRVIDAIANESSIFFFFIAGYLFQHLSTRFQYKNYLNQKLKTVILPYLILSIPALIIFTLLTQRTGMWSWFYTIPTWQQVVLFILTGKHLTPLWFVPTISLFYIAAPLFIKIDREKPKLYWLITPLLALSIYLGRNGPLGPIDKAFYLLPIYMMGMAFSHYRVQAEQIVLRYWIPLLLMTSLGFIGFVFEWNQPPYYLMVMKAPMVLLLTVALLSWHHVFGSRLNYIAEISFGIFFIHAYFISAIKTGTVYLIYGKIYAGEGTTDFAGNWYVFLAYAGLVLIFSIVTIWIAQKALGKRSRFVIGA
jgi:surface polysaccharide O-acyltransferase-like enzyme